MPTVYIKTYGCQMNERDSEAVAAQLVERGYTLVGEESDADVILLNTCSVRDLAEQKALRKMETLTHTIRKRGRKRAGVLGFMGCMAQSRGADLFETLPDVDLVVGTQKFHRVAEHLNALLDGGSSQIADVGEEPGSESALREHLIPGAGPVRRATAYVSIMQGCNQFCTFCIVPATRGLERSRPMVDIVSECRELVRQGIREVTLLGQIVTSYGKREIGIRDGKSAFVQLLESVSEVEGLERIRFTAPHPKGYGDDLVEAYGLLPKLCEHAHLPVQSGSDRVLRLMHRGYTRARYLELVGKLRAVQPRIGLGTDIIVGFPGETVEDFEATCSLVREARFDQAYVFKYSSRKDTPAAAMPGVLPQATIDERHAQLLAIVNEVGSERYRSMVGQEVEVLVEGPSRKNADRFEGRTRTNKIVVFDRGGAEVGARMKMRVVRCGTFTLYGKCAEEVTRSR